MTEKLSATLEIPQWNVILQVLYDAPAKLSMPIILTLQDQLVPRDQRPNVVPMEVARD
jgi:hypothetical protein